MLLELSAPSCKRYPPISAFTECSRAWRKSRTHNSKSPSARYSVLNLPPARSHKLRRQNVDSCWIYLFAPARNRPRDQRGTGSTSMVIPVGLIFVGLPVIHSTSRSSRKMLPTVNSPFTCSKSLEFSHPITSPVDRANPAFSAAYNPRFAWLNQQLTSRSYFRIISTVPSVDPSSTTMYSRFGYAWFTIDLMVASRYSSPLYTAVTS